MPDKKTNLSFQPKDLKIDQFAVFDEYIVENPRERVSSKLNFEFLNKESILNCEAGVVLYYNDQPVMKCSIIFAFLIDQSWLNESKQNDKFFIPREWLIFLANSTYGALRGTLAAKLENTGISFLLPFFNLTEIIESPMEIKI